MSAKKTSPMRQVGRVVLGLAALWLAGFLLFLMLMPSPKDTAGLKPADAIVVLTGGRDRINAAATLLATQKGKRLLISGVHHSVADADIARLTGTTQSIVDCCIDLDRVSADTIGNAEETAAWVTRHGYQSIYLVTSDYHMWRSKLLLANALPDCEIAIHPVVSNSSIQALAIEYSKLLVTYVRTLVPI